MDAPPSIRQRIGGLLGPLAFILLLLLPLDLEPKAHWMAAIGAAVVILWVTEAIPLAVTALLGPAVAVLCGVAPAKTAYAAFAHPLIFLFLGGFLLARALFVHRVDQRVALWILSQSWIDGSPQRVLIAVCLLSFALSMWVSNTATTAMLLPIVAGMLDTIAAGLQQPKQRQQLAGFREGTYIALAYSASIGGICTPIGTAPNILAIGYLKSSQEISIDFLQWMTLATPAGLIALVFTIMVAQRRFPSPCTRVEGLEARMKEKLAELGPTTSSERRVWAVFGLTVLAWLTPSILRLSLGDTHELYRFAKQSLIEGNVAMLGALSLFIIPNPKQGAQSDPTKTAPNQRAIPRRTLLVWSDVRDIDWSTLYLLGGGIALGALAFQSGLAQAIGESTVADIVAWSSYPELALLVSASLLVLLMTEITSNTATTNMMLPVLISIAAASGFPASRVIIVVALAASFAFMLPVSTPPNAIVYGSEKVKLRSMIRFGAWMDLFGYIILILLGLFWLPRMSFLEGIS